jgi:hypothetical protein
MKNLARSALKAMVKRFPWGRMRPFSKHFSL